MAAGTATQKTRPSSKLSFTQLEALWIQAGGSATVAPTMAAIALAESGGNPNALNNSAYPNLPSYHPPGPGASPEYSVGLWQINTLAHSQYSPSAMANPLQNAQAAVSIGGANGTRLQNWSTYNNGAFLKYYNNGKSAGINQSGVSISGILNWDPFNYLRGGKPNQVAQAGAKTAQDAGIPTLKTLDQIGKNIMYAVVIMGGGLLMITGLALIGIDLGIAAHSALTQSKPARVARRITPSKTPRRQGDAAIKRGEEVTRTTRPEKVTLKDKRQLRTNKHKRTAEQKAKDRAYGDIPF